MNKQTAEEAVDRFDQTQHLSGMMTVMPSRREMARARKIGLARLSIGALIEACSRAMQAALVGRDRSRIGHWAAWTVMTGRGLSSFIPIPKPIRSLWEEARPRKDAPGVSPAGAPFCF